jgi:DNA-binding NarL/FixJ family response regulator
MEIKLPVLGGIDACREIHDSPDLGMTRVLILTTFEEEANVLRSVRAGARGFVSKTEDSGVILDAIRIVHRGEAYLSPRATRTLLDHFTAPSDAGLAPLAALTNREREVLTQVVHGRTNADIAGEFAISPLTVKTHVNRIMAKVGVHDRAQLVVFAYESGLLLQQRNPRAIPSHSSDMRLR